MPQVSERQAQVGALVRVEGGRCSSQSLVTRCRYYEQFTTEEALQEAAESYGGLTR